MRRVFGRTPPYPTGTTFKRVYPSLTIWLLAEPARASLRWTIADLADKAGISGPTVQAIERTDGDPAISGEGLETTRSYRAARFCETPPPAYPLLTPKAAQIFSQYARDKKSHSYNQLGGGRDRDRTCDPLHVKEVLSR